VISTKRVLVVSSIYKIEEVKDTCMVQSLTINEARLKLEALVKRIHLKKDYVIIKKDGVPIAGMMDIDEFEDYLELQDETVKRHIRKSTDQFLAGKSRPAREFLAELKSTGKKNSKRKR
jgi:PHD/YefM family antitoxin component YafN of YafNO toxin-antitoxin module